MNHSLVDAELFLFTSAITVASFGFIVYFFLSVSGKFRKMLNSDYGEPRYVISQRLLGGAIFGMVPMALILLSGTKKIVDFGIVSPGPETFFWTIILSAIILPMNYFNARTSANLKMYPQIRAAEWSIALLMKSAFSWVIYLLSYEFLFRGFLFFTAIPIIGLWPAIILNTSIYSLVHLPKGSKETVGAIPLGIVLCYLTFKTGSIWVAVFTHIIMALSNEWFSLRIHPQMIVKIVRK